MIHRVAVVVASVAMVTCSVADNDTASFVQADSPPVVLVTTSRMATTAATQQAVSEPVRRVQNILDIHTAAAAMSTPSSILTSTTSRSMDSIPPMTTSTVTLPPAYDDLLHRRYSMYERGDDVLALQIHFGLKRVDGIYGPVTRAAHMDFLGGPSSAIYVFFPEFGQTPTPCHGECLPGDGHYELPTLNELVDRYFQPDDRVWALRVAFCESSAKPSDIGSVEVSSALAVGWFQHLAKYWIDRSTAAGWADYDIFHAEANVAVAAWLFYEGGGARHWNPSRTCWEER